MKITKRTQRQFRIQQILFYILLSAIVILVAVLSTHTDTRFDWTANNRHTLSETTVELLQQLSEPVTINVFISANHEYRPAIESQLNRYQAQSDKLNIQYIQPETEPELVRQLNIQQQGEMVISLNERSEHVLDLSEQSLTNALVSVSRNDEKWLVFIEGHGERKPFGQSNFDLATWSEQLQRKGLKIMSLNLVEHAHIPENTAAVIIASPQQAWLPGETRIINDYIDNGGNLLLLTDPADHQHLSAITEKLDIGFLSGTVLDPNSAILGIDDPRFVLITDYANHPVGAATKTVTLFPDAVALETLNSQSDWQITSLLNTQANSWSETAVIDDNPTQQQYDEGKDIPGPFALSYLLTRPVSNENEDHQQRIAIIGDADFISNSYIGNGGNLDLGVALANWLSADDKLITIPVKTTIDQQLNLSHTASLVIGIGFLFMLPLLLLGIGFYIWWKRRRR